MTDKDTRTYPRTNKYISKNSIVFLIGQLYIDAYYYYCYHYYILHHVMSYIRNVQYRV